VPVLLRLTLPAGVQAQFNYTDNNEGTATITGYTDSARRYTLDHYQPGGCIPCGMTA